MGKKPLNEQQVKTLRKIVSDKPLHELLLNLSVDLMLRSSDLLSLRVKRCNEWEWFSKNRSKSEADENRENYFVYSVE